MPKITLFTIQDKSIDFAARIHATASPEDRAAIQEYGACLLVNARVGAKTLAKFSVALSNCWTPEYEEFTSYLLENELTLLENEVAKLVARLGKYEKVLK